MPSWFDDVVKPAYRRWFMERGVQVETEREVLAHIRTIDLVAELFPQDLLRLTGTCFDYMQLLNIIEFKGPRNPITGADFARLMSRSWGVVIEERLPDEQSPIGEDAIGKTEGGNKNRRRAREQVPSPIHRTVAIVCVTRPTAILNGAAQGYRFEPMDEPGVYICREMLTVRIFVPYEMELIERNYPLMPLAKGQKLKDFVELCAREERSDLLQMSLELAGVTGALDIWPQIREAAQVKTSYPPKALAVIEREIRQLPDLPTNKRLRELEEKAVQAEAMLSQANATAAQAEAMLKRSEVRHLQTALLRLAGRKFGQVSENVARRVEATQDMAQLNSWFDQIADAGALEDTNLGSQG
jgi:hypothetical protein